MTRRLGAQLALDFDKRWHEGAQHWVRPERDVFDPAGYAVDVLEDHAAARRFIIEHHYEHTPAPINLALGLYGPRGELAGVATLGESAGPAVQAKYAGPALRPASAELNRFVLLPSVGYNGETWFLSRAFKLARGEKSLRAIISFADPLERRCGELIVKPAHWGTIYKATNALHLGRAYPRTHLVAPSGRPVSPRAMSKIAGGERGAEYASRQLVDAGAPPRLEHESGAEWLARVKRSPGFTSRRHPGNLVYVFGLDDGAKRELRALHAEAIQPYPRAA